MRLAIIAILAIALSGCAALDRLKIDAAASDAKVQTEATLEAAKVKTKAAVVKAKVLGKQATEAFKARFDAVKAKTAVTSEELKAKIEEFRKRLEKK